MYLKAKEIGRRNAMEVKPKAKSHNYYLDYELDSGIYFGKKNAREKDLDWDMDR